MIENEKKEWHYTLSGQQCPPVTLSALQTMVTIGVLLPTDMIWKPGMEDWVVADSIVDHLEQLPDETPTSHPNLQPNNAESNVQQVDVTTSLNGQEVNRLGNGRCPGCGNVTVFLTQDSSSTFCELCGHRVDFSQALWICGSYNEQDKECISSENLFLNADVLHDSPDVIPNGCTSYKYFHGDVEFGPYTWETIVRLARNGRIEPNDLVNSSGMAPWIRLPAREVVGLFSETSQKNISKKSKGSRKSRRNLRPKKKRRPNEGMASGSTPLHDNSHQLGNLNQNNSTSDSIHAEQSLVQPENKGFLSKVWAFITKHKCPACSQRSGEKIKKEYLTPVKQFVRSKYDTSTRQMVQKVYNGWLQMNIFKCEACSHEWSENESCSREA